MKKILLTILLCLYMTNVSALTYSDYSEFSEYTDEVIYADDLTDVKTERRYKYYKLTKELGPYEKEETINSNYPLIDYDDYTYTKESEYLIEQPEEAKGRVITTHDVYHYKKAKALTYIEIINSNTQNIDMNINNLSVKYNNEVINYQIENKNAENNIIKPQGSIKLIFEKPLELRYTNLSFQTWIPENKTIKLFIPIGNNELEIVKCNYNITTQTRDFNLNLSDMSINSNAYEDYYTEEYEVPTMNTKYQGKATAYTYKDILYRKYNLKKEYYKEYLTQSIDDYIYQDSDNYKDYYAKRTRTIIPDTIPSDENGEETKEDEIEKNSETNNEGQALKNNAVKKLLTRNKNITAIDKLNKPLTKNNSKSNNKKPSMLLKIDNDKVFDDNSLDNNYKIIKTETDKTTPIEKQSSISNYLSYILIILIFLALLLSKLYKKKK